MGYVEALQSSVCGKRGGRVTSLPVAVVGRWNGGKLQVLLVLQWERAALFRENGGIYEGLLDTLWGYV